MRTGLTAFLAGLAALGGSMAATAQGGPSILAADTSLLPGRSLKAFAPAEAGPGAHLSLPPLPPRFQPFRPAAAEPVEPSLSTAKPVLTASAGADMPLPGPGAASAGPPAQATPVAADAPARSDRQGPQAPASKAPAPVPPTAKPASPAAPMPIQPATVVAAAPTAAPARAEPLTEREIVERANAYFSGLTSLVADFTQIGGDGRRLGGTLYLQRPGKLRFEYDKPSTLEVIADGSSVAVQDTKLATQDLYPISQTPLKFLLRERVNLGQDIKITGIANDGDSVRISLEDRSTLGGTSRITLFFDSAVENLTQWRIVDPQGYQTTVLLNRIDRTRRIDQKLFVININSAIRNDNTNR